MLNLPQNWDQLTICPVETLIQAGWFELDEPVFTPSRNLLCGKVLATAFLCWGC